jgi:biotin carboxyl carrier protein
VSDDPVGRDPASRGAAPSEELLALTDEVLPALIARLRASRLGELEVRTAGWRVRLRRDGSTARARATGTVAGVDDDVPQGPAADVARSPAVGYFDPAPDLAVGTSVLAEDLLGTIDVMGIVQEVNAPSDGIISAVLVEAGQAVEYGQVLAEIDPFEVEPEGIGADAGEPA